jgi:4,5-DOPA dioxygenase extradiol
VTAGNTQRLQRAFETSHHAQRAHPIPENVLSVLQAVGGAADTLPATVVEGGIVHRVPSMDGFVFGADATAGAL